MNYFTSSDTTNSSSNNNKKSLVSLQQLNSLSRKRFSQDLTSTLTNLSSSNTSTRPVSITSEYLADKLNSIRAQHQQQQQQQHQLQLAPPPLRIKKSRSSLYSSSSSSLYRQPLLSNSYLSNPSPRIRLRNLTFKTQPFRSFFTRLSTVFEEEDHPSNNNSSNNNNLTSTNNSDFNKPKLANTNQNNKPQLLTNSITTSNFTISSNSANSNRANRLVSHRLNGSLGKKFKPTAYYSSFENEKNEIDYESFLYTDPSLNTSNAKSNELNQLEFNQNSKRASFTPLNLKADFRIDATDKNILNEFNLLLLDELKRIKARNQQQNNNEIENLTKSKEKSSASTSTNEDRQHQSFIEAILSTKQSKNIQTNLQAPPKKQSVYTSTDNDDLYATTNSLTEPQTVYKILNANPPIPPGLVVNKKQQQSIKIASPSQLINKIKPVDPNASSLTFSLNEAPKVRVIARGNGEGQMPPRPNKVSSPPVHNNNERTSPKSVSQSKPNFPDSYHKPTSSPRTVSTSLPAKSPQIKSPTNVKYSNEINKQQQQLSKDILYYNYSDPYQNLITQRKDNSQSSSNALSNYYNKLYSTDLRPEQYNYEDYLYKPSSYYEDASSQQSVNSKSCNKLTDSFSSLLSLKNVSSPSSSPLSYTSNSSPLIFSQNSQPTLSRQEPYHVTSIPVVYVNSANRSDKIIINPAASQPLPLFTSRPNRVINIEDIKREIEKEAEEITENKLNQKQHQQHQLIEQIKQEVVAAVAAQSSSSASHNVSPIQEEEEPDEVEQENQTVNVVNDEDEDEETTEEIMSEKISSEETTSSEEVEIISEDTSTTTSEENTNTIDDANNTTVDDLTSDEVNLQNQVNTQIRSPDDLIKFESPTPGKSSAVSPIMPSQSTTPSLDSNKEDSNNNNDNELLKEDQESELVNMIKDIKSTLESCCVKEDSIAQQQAVCDTRDNEEFCLANGVSTKKTVIRNLPVYHNKLKNAYLNEDSANSINTPTLNTTQDELEENEIFEIVY